MAALEVSLDAGEVDPLGKLWRLAGDTVNGFGYILNKRAGTGTALVAIGFAVELFQMLSFSFYSLDGSFAWNWGVIGWLQTVCSSMRMFDWLFFAQNWSGIRSALYAVMVMLIVAVVIGMRLGYLVATGQAYSNALIRIVQPLVSLLSGPLFVPALGVCALNLTCAPAGTGAGECGSGAYGVHAALGGVFGVALLVLAVYANGVVFARLPNNQTVSSRLLNRNQVCLVFCKFVLTVLYALVSAPAGVNAGAYAFNRGAGAGTAVVTPWVLVFINFVCQLAPLLVHVQSLQYYSFALNQYVGASLMLGLWAAFDLALVTLLAAPSQTGTAWLFYVFGGVAAMAGVNLVTNRRADLEAMPLDALTSSVDCELCARFAAEPLRASLRAAMAVRAGLAGAPVLHEADNGDAITIEAAAMEAEFDKQFVAVERILAFGAARFPGDAHMALARAQYCLAYRRTGAQGLALSSLQRCARGAHALAFDVHFAVALLRREFEEAFVGARANTEVADYLRFQGAMGDAAVADLRASRCQAALWEELCKHSIDIAELDHVAARLNDAADAALGAYRRALAMNANSSQTLRAFSSFLADVLNEDAYAARLVQQADDIDQHTAACERASVATAGGDALALQTARAALTKAVGGALFDERNGLISVTAELERAGEIVSANAVVCQWLGHKASDLVGENVQVVMPEPYATLHPGFVQRYLSTGESRVLGHARLLFCAHRAGHLVPVEVNVREVTNYGAHTFLAVLRQPTLLAQMRNVPRQLQARAAVAATASTTTATTEHAATDPMDVNDEQIHSLLDAREPRVRAVHYVWCRCDSYGVVRAATAGALALLGTSVDALRARACSLEQRLASATHWHAAAATPGGRRQAAVDAAKAMRQRWDADATTPDGWDTHLVLPSSSSSSSIGDDGDAEHDDDHVRTVAVNVTRVRVAFGHGNAQEDHELVQLIEFKSAAQIAAEQRANGSGVGHHRRRSSLGGARDAAVAAAAAAVASQHDGDIMDQALAGSKLHAPAGAAQSPSNAAADDDHGDDGDRDSHRGGNDDEALAEIELTSTAKSGGSALLAPPPLSRLQTEQMVPSPWRRSSSMQGRTGARRGSVLDAADFHKALDGVDAHAAATGRTSAGLTALLSQTQTLHRRLATLAANTQAVGVGRGVQRMHYALLACCAFVCVIALARFLTINSLSSALGVQLDTLAVAGVRRLVAARLAYAAATAVWAPSTYATDAFGNSYAMVNFATVDEATAARAQLAVDAQKLDDAQATLVGRGYGGASQSVTSYTATGGVALSTTPPAYSSSSSNVADALGALSAAARAVAALPAAQVADVESSTYFLLRNGLGGELLAQLNTTCTALQTSAAAKAGDFQTASGLYLAVSLLAAFAVLVGVVRPRVARIDANKERVLLLLGRLPARLVSALQRTAARRVTVLAARMDNVELEDVDADTELAADELAAQKSGGGSSVADSLSHRSDVPSEAGASDDDDDDEGDGEGDDEASAHDVALEIANPLFAGVGGGDDESRQALTPPPQQQLSLGKSKKASKKASKGGDDIVTSSSSKPQVVAHASSSSGGEHNEEAHAARIVPTQNPCVRYSALLKFSSLFCVTLVYATVMYWLEFGAQRGDLGAAAAQVNWSSHRRLSLLLLVYDLRRLATQAFWRTYERGSTQLIDRTVDDFYNDLNLLSDVQTALAFGSTRFGTLSVSTATVSSLAASNDELSALTFQTVCSAADLSAAVAAACPTAANGAFSHGAHAAIGQVQSAAVFSLFAVNSSVYDASTSSVAQCGSYPAACASGPGFNYAQFTAYHAQLNNTVRSPTMAFLGDAADVYLGAAIDRSTTIYATKITNALSALYSARLGTLIAFIVLLAGAHAYFYAPLCWALDAQQKRTVKTLLFVPAEVMERMQAMRDFVDALDEADKVELTAGAAAAATSEAVAS